VVAAIVVEASLLVLLFAVMFFSPPDDDLAIDGGADGEVSQELLRELGEIGRDYAAMAVQLEAIAGTLQDVVDRQNDMTESMRISVQAAVEAVAPNPNLMKSMSETTAALSAFTTSIDALRERLQAVERQEVERLVRNELEKLLSRNIVERDGQGR
jgi:division protein CdvB (Snf7/Vps24/ESCRT-III family)